MEQPQVHGPVFLIEAEKIKPNPQQPRRTFDEESLRELANSIREFGILQPLVVSKLEQETEAGTQVEYQLIAGERRLLAARMVGLERVPAIIRSVALDKERLELAIVENIQRVDLNPIEAARAYAKLQDHFGLTQREIAARVGKSRETIANTVRLLGLPNAVQEALGRGQVSESQARLLLSVADLAEQQSLFDDIMKSNMSVRELKMRISQSGRHSRSGAAVARDAVHAADPEAKETERELEEFLGARVTVERSGESGKITISFYSPEELQGIVQKLLDRERITQASVPPLEAVPPEAQPTTPPFDVV
ncbi:MAG: ParB/RepB/Spo0J family partition protein [Planctomycetota bacterium]